MKIIRFGGQFTKLCFIAVFACLFALGPASTVRAITSGFHVSGRLLLDANGNNFVMRGINVPHNWYPDETSSSFQNIKAKGANTVRIVLSNGQSGLWPKDSASDVANVINLCKANKLICVLEVHDTTAHMTTLAQAVDYWIEIESALVGQEAYVIINIGNEPYGNPPPEGPDTSLWIGDTIDAIAELRAAGLQHMLMVDGPDWGQDWEHIMRDNAASIFNSDPLRNTVFSIHMYGVYEQASAIQAYVASFVNAGLPLVIGEFAHFHSDGDPDEDTILSTAQSNGIGYLGWSWSGNSSPGEYLDMVVNFDPNQETPWGNRIIGGENGICQTSVEASVYGGHMGPCSTFNDVPSNYWANNYIERLYSAGITGGCSTTPLSYCPENAVTRAQISVFLEKGVHHPNAFTPPDLVPTFNDTVGHWAENWIEALRNDGITGGCGTNLYCPEDSVTRAQMAVFLLKSKYGSGYIPPTVGTSTGFTDVPITHWAAAWIKQLAAEGITGGCGTGIYCPESQVTRAQMAVFLVRTFNLP